MARIISGNLGLEINFKSIDFGEVTLEIGFLWQGESLINDSVLERSSDWWASRSAGRFLANLDQGEPLLNLIERVLETGEPDCYEWFEPDFILAIYPNLIFPFIVPYWRRQAEPEDACWRNGIWYAGKRAGEEKKASDDFSLIMLIDTYNFKNSGGYSTQGISLQLIATRKELEDFHRELSAEIVTFKEAHRFDERCENLEIFRFGETDE